MVKANRCGLNRWNRNFSNASAGVSGYIQSSNCANKLGTNLLIKFWKNNRNWYDFDRFWTKKTLKYHGFSNLAIAESKRPLWAIFRGRPSVASPAIPERLLRLQSMLKICWRRIWHQIETFYQNFNANSSLWKIYNGQAIKEINTRGRPSFLSRSNVDIVEAM